MLVGLGAGGGGGVRHVALPSISHELINQAKSAVFKLCRFIVFPKEITTAVIVSCGSRKTYPLTSI